MTISLSNLIPAKYASNTQTTEYTSENKTAIDKFTATNISSSTATLSINIVFVSGSVSDANKIVDSVLVPPSETYLCPEMVGQVLEAGSFISVIASTSSAIVISASGRKIS